MAVGLKSLQGEQRRWLLLGLLASLAWNWTELQEWRWRQENHVSCSREKISFSEGWPDAPGKGMGSLRYDDVWAAQPLPRLGRGELANQLMWHHPSLDLSVTSGFSAMDICSHLWDLLHSSQHGSTPNTSLYGQVTPFALLPFLYQ